MTPATKRRLIEWAIATNPKQPPEEILTQSQQLAIAIYKEIPADGNFIKANAIAIKLKRSPNQVKEILGLIRSPWNLTTSKNNTTGGYGRND